MADIGTILREARIRERIEISQVEARTKIRAKYLRAMENEEWDLLPGPVYAKSFLRTYGDFLGVDSRALVDEYKRRYERPTDHDMRPIGSMRREREPHRRGPRLGRIGAVVLVLVAVGVALYVVGSLGNGSSSTSSTVAGRTTSTGAARGHHRAHRSRHAPPKPTSVTLELVPTSTVYVCVEDGNGNRLIPGRIFSAGQAIPTEKAKKMLITLGNSSVQMKVNGKAMTVAAGAPIGYELTPHKVSLLPQARLPTCT